MTASRLVGVSSPRRGTAWRIAAAASLVLLVSTDARGAIVSFSATIDGVQETPPNASMAMGSGTFTMDTTTDTLAYTIMITVPPPTAEIAAHIHGYAGPGVPAGIVHPLPLGTPKVGVWGYPPLDEGMIIAGLTYVNIHTMAFGGGEIRGQILRVPTCGDGILDGGEACDDGNLVNGDGCTDTCTIQVCGNGVEEPGEECDDGGTMSGDGCSATCLDEICGNTVVDVGEDCDDGNVANGDCCSSTCDYEAMGSACTAGAGLCGSGECDGAGACVAAPRGGCRTALKSVLLIKRDTSNDTKDKLIFKWIKGQQTDQDDFGVPTGTTNYALCVFDGNNAVITDPQVPFSASLWSPISDKGYKYKDPGGSQDGVQKVILKGGAADKAKALVKGKGTGLPDAVMVGMTVLPVTAQLVNDDGNVCFEGVYDSGDVLKDDDVQFKAKAQ